MNLKQGLQRSSSALLFALLLNRAIVFSQMPKELPPDVRDELAKSPVPPPSNQQVGIDIDRFIGHPSQSSVRVSREVIMMRTILRHGDPYKPGEPGAVLENRKDLAVGTVLGHRQSPLAETSDHQFWYVESGVGQLDNGSEYWDLKEGTELSFPRMLNTALQTLLTSRFSS